MSSAGVLPTLGLVLGLGAAGTPTLGPVGTADHLAQTWMFPLTQVARD